MKTSLAASSAAPRTPRPAREAGPRPPPPPTDTVPPAAPPRERLLPLVLVVDFRTEREFVLEHATNLCAGGLYVRTPLRAPRDTRVQVRLRLPIGTTLQTTGRVAFLVEGQEPGGLGVELAREDEAFWDAIDAYVASLV